MFKSALFSILIIFVFLGCSETKSKSEPAPKIKTLEPFFKSFDQTKIAFTDEGKGVPIILIHGFISNGSSWNKTVIKTKLLEKGYRVIVPDLRGNGKSDRPQDPKAYQNDAEIKDLIRLANHLELKKYIAIGYSRGSIILAKLLTKENRISQAVLGGMGVDFTNPNWGRRIAFADAFTGRTKLTELTEGAVNYAKSIDTDLNALGHPTRLSTRYVH